jgi:hypothetical protein
MTAANCCNIGIAALPSESITRLQEAAQSFTNSSKPVTGLQMSEGAW